MRGGWEKGVAVNIILHAQGHQGSILSDHHRTMVFGPKFSACSLLQLSSHSYLGIELKSVVQKFHKENFP